MPVLNAVEDPAFQASGDVYALLKQALEEVCARWYDPAANAFDYRGFAGSREYGPLVVAACGLGAYDCERLAVGKRLPFWLNVYNALVLHAVSARGGAIASRLDKEFFVESGYVVAGREFSLDDIEHGLIRGNAPRFLAMRRQMPKDDARLALAPYVFDERAHFALHSACRSAPRLRVYGRTSAAALLEEAASAYVRDHVRIEKDGALMWLPKIFQWYGQDFGGENGVRAFVIDRLEREEDVEALDRRGGRCDLRYIDFDWSLNQR